MRVQLSGFLALSSQAVLAELCERTSNVVNTGFLRNHLAQQLAIEPDEIFVNVKNDSLDIGTCKCGGQDCFPDSITSIEFIINAKSFTHEDYFIINSCFRAAEINKLSFC